MGKRLLFEKINGDSLITCDNPTCDYKIPYSEEEAKNIHFYIDVSCPKCGENLLTEKDYNTHTPSIVKNN